MSKRVLISLAVLALFALPASAQWGALNKLSGGSGGGDVDAVVTSGTKIIVCGTIASDLAVNAATQMLQAFPDDKVAASRDKFSKYNELKGKRGTE